ncbi:hypothetical protein [uncultured Allobaculum sp.]|uniref:hypothetical protein n=1 Tax=uncultured Allobaculum sp. TaxID=1187017 RepID=UPI00259930B5|nr:hypothetical protein [uncultured Allobaculum sp.]
MSGMLKIAFSFLLLFTKVMTITLILQKPHGVTPLRGYGMQKENSFQRHLIGPAGKTGRIRAKKLKSLHLIQKYTAYVFYENIFIAVRFSFHTGFLPGHLRFIYTLRKDSTEAAALPLAQTGDFFVNRLNRPYAIPGTGRIPDILQKVLKTSSEIPFRI